MPRRHPRGLGGGETQIALAEFGELGTGAHPAEGEGGIGPGGEHLTHEHTFRNFRSEFYQPIIEERRNFSAWQKSGAQTIEERANAKWKEILENYTEPELPGDVKRDLKKFVDKKRR